MADEIRTPWHLWAIGVVSLLWNGIGGIDYTMTRLRSSAYLSLGGDPAVILTWIDRMPWWMHVAWPVGVWGGVLGSILLLARSRFAVWAFLVSLAGAAATTTYDLTAPASEFTQGRSPALPLVIVVVAVLLWLYSRRMATRGVLA